MKNIFKKAKEINVKNIFKKKERGAVNLVEIIIIIGVGLVLAFLFKETLSDMLKAITTSLSDKISTLFK